MQEVLTAMAADLRERLAAQVQNSALLIGLIVFFAVVLLVFRLLSGRRAGTMDVRLQWGAPPPAPEPAQPWEDRKEELLRRLDTAERGLGRFYIVFLCLLEAAATGLMVFAYVTLPDDGSREFLLLYGGAAYAAAMLWMTAQLFSTLRRISPPADLLSGMRSRIHITTHTSPQVQFIDDERLDRAQRHLDRGGSLEEACAMIEPRYRDMAAPMQGLFRDTMSAALAQRRQEAGR